MTATEQDGMTLREVLEGIGYPNDSDPLECMFIIAGFMRSAVQGEPSTFEGDCSSIVAVMKKTGRDFKTMPDVVWLVGLLGEVPDIKAPNSFWKLLAEADERDMETD